MGLPVRIISCFSRFRIRGTRPRRRNPGLRSLLAIEAVQAIQAGHSLHARRVRSSNISYICLLFK